MNIDIVGKNGKNVFSCQGVFAGDVSAKRERKE